MIGRQIKGRGFRGLLAYLHGKAGAEIVAGPMDGRTPRELAREFGAVRRLRPNLSRAVFHMPVRPAPGETLSASQWREVAERIAAGMGFAEAPWVAYLHRDAREEHLHLVASRVTYDGRVVSEQNDYRRGMAVLRGIERDLGLSLGPPERPDRKPPGLAEIRSVPEGLSVRAWLQREIERAAEGRVSLKTFFERLEQAGVVPIPSLDALARPRGISYAAEGRAFAGSSLGAAYSFPGIQTRLGVRFDPHRDLPLLAQYRERAVPRSHSLPEVPVMPESHSSSDSPAAAAAIRRQLRALGAERVDLLLVETRTGEREIRSGLTASDVERELGGLRERNEKGAEVLFRPAGDSPSVLVSGVSSHRLSELRRNGLDPAAVVNVGAGQREVWFRHRETLDRAEANLVQAILANEVRGRAPKEPEPWGHLAGLSAPYGGTDRQGEVLVALAQASGTRYERGDEIRDQAREILLAQGAEREIGRLPKGDLEAALDREARDPLRGLGLRGEPVTGGLDREVDAWREARDRYLELRAEGPAPRGDAVLAREIEIVEAFRRLAEIEQRLEERTGLRPLPAHLEAAGLADAADVGERWGQAVRDAERAADRALLSGRPEVRAIRDEREAVLAARAEEALSFSAERGVRIDPAPGLDLGEAALASRLPEPREIEARTVALREAIEHLGTTPGPVEIGVLREAFERKIEVEIGVEAVRADLSRAARALAIERDDLASRVERFERVSREEPISIEARNRKWEVVDRFEQVDQALGAVRGRLAEVEVASIDRALARSGLTLGDEKTVWDTAGEPFRRYAERLAERGELVERIGGRDPDLAREIRPEETPELVSAREDLGRSAARVLEERSPQALEEYRTAATRVGAIESTGRDRTAEVEFEAARRDLHHALRALTIRPEARDAGPLDPAALERFRVALDRFHGAEERLASRLPEIRRGSERSGDDRFAALLDRVRRGDRTPDTLSRLDRAVGQELRGARREASPGEPLPTKHDLLSGLDRYRRARVELSWQLHRHGKALDRRDPEALVRFQPALARYQVAAQDLERATERFLRDPKRRLLPVRYFLRHPHFKGAPHRALAAWARYASERGVAPSQLRAHLSRGVSRGQLARPSLYGGRWAGRAAFWGARWAGRTLHRLVQDEVRSR